MNFSGPGGLGQDMSANMTGQEMLVFTDNLFSSQERRFIVEACLIQSRGGLFYYETYESVFVRAEWTNGVLEYRATDLVVRPCES